jgi:hypothetical protein
VVVDVDDDEVGQESPVLDVEDEAAYGLAPSNFLDEGRSRDHGGRHGKDQHSFAQLDVVLHNQVNVLTAMEAPTVGATSARSKEGYLIGPAVAPAQNNVPGDNASAVVGARQPSTTRPPAHANVDDDDGNGSGDGNADGDPAAGGGGAAPLDQDAAGPRQHIDLRVAWQSAAWSVPLEDHLVPLSHREQDRLRLEDVTGTTWYPMLVSSQAPQWPSMGITALLQSAKTFVQTGSLFALFSRVLDTASKLFPGAADDDDACTAELHGYLLRCVQASTKMLGPAHACSHALAWLAHNVGILAADVFLARACVHYVTAGGPPGARSAFRMCCQDGWCPTVVTRRYGDGVGRDRRAPVDLQTDGDPRYHGLLVRLQSTHRLGVYWQDVPVRSDDDSTASSSWSDDYLQEFGSDDDADDVTVQIPEQSRDRLWRDLCPVLDLASWTLSVRAFEALTAGQEFGVADIAAAQTPGHILLGGAQDLPLTRCWATRKWGTPELQFCHRVLRALETTRSAGGPNAVDPMWFLRFRVLDARLPASVPCTVVCSYKPEPTHPVSASRPCISAVVCDGV